MIHLKNSVLLILFVLISFNVVARKGPNVNDDLPPIPIDFYKILQWQSSGSYYSFTKKEITLFRDSNLKSNIMYIIKKHESVNAILRRKEGNNLWTLLGYYSDEKGFIYGWTLEENLLFVDEFELPFQWRFKTIKIDYYDNKYEYSFDENGKFSVTWKAYKYDKDSNSLYQEPIRIINCFGQAMQYEDIIWFKIYDNKLRNNEVIYRNVST